MYKKIIKEFDNLQDYFEDKKKFPGRKECELKINHVGKVELVVLEGV